MRNISLWTTAQVSQLNLPHGLPSWCSAACMCIALTLPSLWLLPLHASHIGAREKKKSSRARRLFREGKILIARAWLRREHVDSSQPDVNERVTTRWNYAEGSLILPRAYKSARYPTHSRRQCTRLATSSAFPLLFHYFQDPDETYTRVYTVVDGSGYIYMCILASIINRQDGACTSSGRQMRPLWCKSSFIVTFRGATTRYRIATPAGPLLG